MAAKTKTAKCTFLSEDLHIKMCKKIADLTRVVDKLFRSHYEQSIDYETIKDRQTKIQSEIKEKDVKIIALNKTVQELRDKLLLLETSKEDNEQVTNELQSKLNSINSLYEEERKENDILKQQLAERQQPEEEKSFNNDKECTLCSELNCELIELKEQLQNLQNDTKKLKKEAKNITQDKTKLNEKLQSSLTEITLLKEQLTHSQSLVGQYQSNNEELTTTIARLKEKLANIQCSKAMTVQHQPAAHVKKQKRQYWLETTPIKEKGDDELERLKREVMRYKMELINRETNFNRVFTTSGSKTTLSSPTHVVSLSSSSRRSPLLKDTNNDSLLLPKLQGVIPSSLPSLNFRK